MPNAALLITALVFREVPGGPVNCQNLIFTTTKKFITNSLELWIDGLWKTPALDFKELPDQESFEIILGTSINRLKLPPEDDEELYVRYIEG